MTCKVDYMYITQQKLQKKWRWYCSATHRQNVSGWKQCEWATLMAKLAMRMRCVSWPGGRGSSNTTYLESATPICLFTDDRSRGLGVARGRISHFPIDLRRRPYNTRTVCDVTELNSENKKAISLCVYIIPPSILFQQFFFYF